MSISVEGIFLEELDEPEQSQETFGHDVQKSEEDQRKAKELID